MAAEDLIDFDVIEAQKENIQSLPSGRSAKKLVDLFSPTPLHKLSTPTPTDTKNINDCIRAEYEAEISSLSEVDDPLDVFDRYVRWTLDAFPSAQATPQSQLHTLLERATKTFVGSNQYKNDPRYLKLWLHYIHFFSDAPRETFMYLSRHGIGEGLALFYEEYAAWLEGAARWAQAEEVYKLGIEREARPQQRLIRKFGEFEQRRGQLPEEPADAPSSPALPSVRPVLAAKIDPFAAAAAHDPQAPRQHSGVGGQASKPGKAKMAIFSDAGAAAPALSSRDTDSKGWENIGTLADRKKENAVEPKPWVGETLNAGGKKSSGKMAIFRDTSLAKSHITIHPAQYQVTMNPQNGKKERVFVDLRTIYPTPDEPGTELSFEEVWAAKRGLLNQFSEKEEPSSREVSPPVEEDASHEMEVLVEAVSSKLVVHHDVVLLDENGAMMHPPLQDRPKKKKVMEVNETQIIKAKLDSPSGPKIRKRGSSEPTMTMHTKAATDDIYEIFNQPLKAADEEDHAAVSEDDYETDGDYTSGAESTGTTRQLSISEAGDDEEVDEVEAIDADETSDVKSVSEWSDFTARKHIPNVADDHSDHTQDLAQDDTQSSGMVDPNDAEELPGHVSDRMDEQDDEDNDVVLTPVIEDSPPKTRTVFIPIPPEDYVPPTRTYRDPVEMANNRLPFMTPITERTESSLEFGSGYDDQPTGVRTPSKAGELAPPARISLESEPMSSPLIEIVNEARPRPKIAQPALQKAKPIAKAAPPKGPIIKERQCNPVDEGVRLEILSNMQPSLSSYGGFYDHRNEKYERGEDIRRYAKTISKVRNGTRRSSSIGMPVIIQFPDAKTEYVIKRELGAGAYAPVYLVENSHPETTEDEDSPVVMGKGTFAAAHIQRSGLEALKMETPPTPWEFHMMRLAHIRMGAQHRSAASLSTALECHLYQDETFLFLPYHQHGTLLDVVNGFRAEPSGTMDEVLAMFFSVELLRTVEALHARQILHGDLKADNCLLRLDTLSAWAADGQLASQWHTDGSGGWGARGVVLIDFGRAIDMRAFSPDVQFIADWKTSGQDCAEMREGRPWTWQIDYHGLAGVMHCLLFGRYIETVRADAGGLGTQAGRRYKIRESLKRYWQTDIWSEAFDLLLNPAGFVEGEEGARMPVLRGMRSVREKMEAWLEGNCERGVGLKSLMAKVEGWTKSKRV